MGRWQRNERDFQLLRQLLGPPATQLAGALFSAAQELLRRSQKELSGAELGIPRRLKDWLVS